MHQKLGGDRTKTGDPTWPKGYPILYGIMLNHKTRGNLLGGLLLLGDWLGISQLVLSNYILHYLFHVFFFFFSPFLSYLTVFISAHKFYFSCRSFERGLGVVSSLCREQSWGCSQRELCLGEPRSCCWDPSPVC